MTQPLTDDQRKLIHDFALDARDLLTQEARELLEGTYGLYADGRLDPPGKLPQVQADQETAETYGRLVSWLKDEEEAGMSRPEAVEKLIKEVAFTHLNRLVAFKMMEARKLIRGTVDRGPESNAFKFYLAAPDHADDYALYRAGQVDAAYRRFLLWQCGQVAREIRVLFDPATLASSLFPRPRALTALLELLNAPGLAEVWAAEETLGWIYQFFNEREKADVFDRLYRQKQKIRRQDIPAATQLFTPNWIVRFLVQNTLGRLWVQMHPNTRLMGTPLLDYLVPLQGEVPPEPLRPVKEITLLDPSCGTMHFGLVAFDLYHAMYQEELEQAGQDGWSETPSVGAEGEIPGAIIARNLFGIDIDLRAVQLSALALYLKAKTLSPKATITNSNLVCADVTPLNGAKLGTFLRQARFSQPIYERLMRALWNRLQDADQLGSLLRLDRELGELIAAERARYQKEPLFAGLAGEYEREAAEDEFWGILSAQIVQGLDHFVRQQAQAGADLTLFAGEAVRGLRLAELTLRKYDVVVTNPPYSGRGNLNQTLSDYLDTEYRDAKSDLYSAFIQRCSEWLEGSGRLGMITQQSFMFLTSFEKLRSRLRERSATETMAHTGSRAFAEISGEKVNATIFCLRAERDARLRYESVGTYFRLVNASHGDGKRRAFEQALRDGCSMYHVAERRFDSIPGSPWVYWLSDKVLRAFETNPKLESVAIGKHGLSTCDTFRYTRVWWEPGFDRIDFDVRHVSETADRGTWFPFMKGGAFQRWFGNQDYVVNWCRNGSEIRADVGQKFPYLGENLELVLSSPEYYFREGVTWTKVSSKGLSTRYMPAGFIIADAGMAFYPHDTPVLDYLAIMNSELGAYILKSVSPTINFTIGDVLSTPLPEHLPAGSLAPLSWKAVWCTLAMQMWDEVNFHFASPRLWQDEPGSVMGLRLRLSTLERRLDDKVCGLYGIDQQSRAVIRAEVTETALDARVHEEAGVCCQDVAPCWLSYGLGIILGRYLPGVPGRPGSAVYRRDAFGVGSLPEPEEDEFDELVGPPERFAYVDDDGGRHVFSREVEKALKQLAVPDGVTVLDESHPRDLAALVEAALNLMLGHEDARDVIQEGTGGDPSTPLRASVRKFLERDFFTKWHFKWYRKRPVYWPLQSAKRNYGFVLFHEKIDSQTLFKLQRDYLDPKLNGLRLHSEDLRGQAAGLSGAALKRVEREIDQTTQLLEEIGEFARTIERLVREGYQPKPDWIDDGVILRMAPLWEMIPIWWREPKKYWERLQKGDYDWSHIAMNYWPDRVREACRANKSFAIAHGHEEWYEGS